MFQKHHKRSVSPFEDSQVSNRPLACNSFSRTIRLIRQPLQTTLASYISQQPSLPTQFNQPLNSSIEYSALNFVISRPDRLPFQRYAIASDAVSVETITNALQFSLSVFAMAVAPHCSHNFKVIKSDTSLIQWMCNLCHSGPHWFIFECRYCKLKTCRLCAGTC